MRRARVDGPLRFKPMSRTGTGEMIYQVYRRANDEWLGTVTSRGTTTRDVRAYDRNGASVSPSLRTLFDAGMVLVGLYEEAKEPA